MHRSFIFPAIVVFRIAPSHSKLLTLHAKTYDNFRLLLTRYTLLSQQLPIL